VSEPVVVRLVEEDWSLLRELRLAALGDSPGAFASTRASELAFDETQWRKRLRSPNPSFVARGDGDVAGLAGGYDDGHHLHLVSMWVRPPWRGRGIASLLIHEVARWAREAGAAELHLWVTDANVAARRRYEHEGFVATGRTQSLPSDETIAELEMTLDLR
jgi:GNAT superfamily N-acetyltransferase